MNAVLHPATRRDIDALLVAAPHAIGLVGPDGAGKGYVAQGIARHLLQHDRDLGLHPYFLHVEPEKGIISIEQAREVTRFLKLKTTSSSAIRRLVLIEHADRMTPEAQNALLKNLEEPPADTVILLTLNSKSNVLPTIMSRLQTVSIRTPLGEQLHDLLVEQGFTPDNVQKTLLLCDGLPGLAMSLLNADMGNDFVDAIDTAKALLAGDSFTRLTMVDMIVSAKQTERVVLALLHISQAALVSSSARSSSEAATKKWTSIATTANDAYEQLQANAQAKLVLANLCLHI